MIEVSRSWTGVASCHTWRYRFTYIPNGDGSTLTVMLWSDSSTGGNEQDNAEMSMIIKGEWEAHEFMAVLNNLAGTLADHLGQPYEIYHDRIFG